MRGIAAMAAGIVLGGCNADIGEPTGPVIIQDAGAEAEADAAKVPTDAKALIPLGVACADASDCESGVCFVGGQASYCSLSCTTSNATTVCAVAPFDGTCNKQGYCRRP